ncbi:hypothetical protein RQP46_003577 [Phenoliferia psychrophenolica]
MNLINATFDWLEANFKGEVDFVVWTGDNARHDIDSRVPRSLPEIFDLNRYIAARIRQAFGKVPVVASIGNNDIYPHNIMFPGPSAITTEFLDIWRHHIPESQLHTFAGGGYYSIEAIKNHLLLISLNTLYMFDNNKAVDGCPPDDESGRDSDPGTEHLAWLEQQLLLARARGMQVWLTGHVPPTPENWYPRCYDTYGELVLSFHDTIVGQLFGHMNVDHFTFIGASDVLPSSSSSRPLTSPSSPVNVLRSSGSVAETLKETYEALPKRRKTHLEDYSVITINPSVIPTYFPAVRIWQYNTSVESRWQQPMDAAIQRENETQLVSLQGDESEDDEDEDHEDHDDLDGDDDDERPPPRARTFLSALAAPLQLVPTTLISLLPPSHPLFSIFSPSPLPLKKRKKHKRRPRPPPRMPRHFSPDSPSLTNCYLTPLGYSQFYIDLDGANLHSGFGPGEKGRAAEAESSLQSVRPPPKWQVEYLTFGAEAFARGLLGGGQGSAVPVGVLDEDVRKVVQGEGVDKVASIVDALRKAKVVPYELGDLTVGSWVGLARRVVKTKKRWRKFLRRMCGGEV